MDYDLFGENWDLVRIRIYFIFVQLIRNGNIVNLIEFLFLAPEVVILKISSNDHIPAYFSTVT